MKTVNTKAINDLNDSLLVSIKMYYNIHLKGGIDNYNYYLSLVAIEHLNYIDQLLNPNPPN